MVAVGPPLLAAQAAAAVSVVGHFVVSLALMPWTTTAGLVPGQITLAVVVAALLRVRGCAGVLSFHGFLLSRSRAAHDGLDQRILE